MKLETIKKLCCPFDKADLNIKIISKDENNHIIEGIFICTDCKRVYPIVSGIPIMNPDEYRDFQLEQPLLDKWEKILIAESGENLKLIEGKLVEK